MTLEQIETLLTELQTQIALNTAAIESLNNTVSNYATTDDLISLSSQINDLSSANSTLSSTVTSLNEQFKYVHHLKNLSDVVINDETENDVLIYSSDGKWHNINVNKIEFDVPTSVTKLSELTDVVISNVTNDSHLMYDSSIGKWTNKILNDENDVTDLSNYLTKAEAKLTYFPFTGGIITGPTEVKSYLHTTGNITSEAAITAKSAIS